ncbi:symmetrical bis(5'-nucleosyl)-tetraphosphatase [Litorivivens sp.]|uniref:symmetrical bis(5'-nucleosyl)-tetraphosphatase n=1 Tax=Litorivivens sp. TaxID=2020868 RepID=UPI003563BB56
MTRYAVGDLQGCLSPLQCLLDDVGFEPAKDELWLVGDLVNRGPDSLAVLDYLYPMRDSLRIVLGNHDLHTLALARGATKQGLHASLADLLASERLTRYIDWFRTLPLCVRSDCGRYVMSHAGIPPLWSTDEALGYSDEVSSALRDDTLVDTFLSNMYGDEPSRWSDDLTGLPRLRTITNYFTRMRICSEDGTLALSFKGRVEEIPSGFAPWFTWPAERMETQIFGHWAALEGKTGNPQYLALDTGCVWGREMTLFNMDSGAFHRCLCAATNAS